MPPQTPDGDNKPTRRLFEGTRQEVRKSVNRRQTNLGGQSRKRQGKTFRVEKTQIQKGAQRDLQGILDGLRHHDKGDSEEHDEGIQQKHKCGSNIASNYFFELNSKPNPAETFSLQNDDCTRKVGTSKLRLSKAQKEQLAKDDEEIAALEKALGIQGRLPKSFTNDGLDELLSLNEVEDRDIHDTKRIRDTEEEQGAQWLKIKRQKTTQDGVPKGPASSRAGASQIHILFDKTEGSIVAGAIRDSDNDDSYNRFDHEKVSPLERVREDPYRAPVTSASEAHDRKYIPPIQGSNAGLESRQVQRKMQGLLNRLSEANLLSVLTDTEKAYRDSPRQVVTKALLDKLMEPICGPSALQDTFIVLLAGFVAAVYKVTGTGFGAEVIQRTVDEIERRKIDARNAESAKSTSNLISFLAELYNFQVVGSILVYDFIRQFVTNISEFHTELLLKVIKHCGYQLRQDDPSSLKEIVAELYTAAKRAEDGSLSVRTKFMMETIHDLKNNRIKAGVASSSLLSEHTAKMKKLLSIINMRSNCTNQPIHVGLADIRDCDKRGKWWLVGSSYKDKNSPKESGTSTPFGKVEEIDELSDNPVDLAKLAKEQGMNTAIRRSIFMAIMSASDFNDAHLRLIKLRLSRSQKSEIPKVLVHCFTTETAYNPFYSLIADKLCEDRRFRMAFQFTIWDMFKDMEDRPSLDDRALSMQAMVSLAKMYASLIVANKLSLFVLSNLNFPYLNWKTRAFIELLLINMIVEIREKNSGERAKFVLRDLIYRTQETPGLGTGIYFFVRKVLRKTDIAGTSRNKRRVLWACGIIESVLEEAATLHEDTS